MKGKVYRLLEFQVSKAERGLWYDHDEKTFDKKGWGIVVKLYAGWVIRPIAWRETNPWQGAEPLLVLRFPCVLPFISIAIGNWGAYLGGKIFDYAQEHDARYWWIGEKYPYGQYLTVSVTTRRTRWK